MFFFLIISALNISDFPEEQKIGLIVFFSVMFIVCIAICIAVPLFKKKRAAIAKARRSVGAIPDLHFPVETRNYVKNPVRRKVYIGLMIFMSIFVVAIAIAAVISWQNGNKDLLFETAVPLCAVFVLAMPFLLILIKNKEIAFFVKYLDFKPTENFEPTEDVAFSKDGLVVKKADDKNNTPDMPAEDIVIAYEHLEFFALPVYKKMGDMMTIFVLADVAKPARTGEMFDLISKLFYPQAVVDDVQKKMLLQIWQSQNIFPAFELRLSQRLFDYLTYYKVSVKDLDYIITHRAELMKKNCKFSNFFKTVFTKVKTDKNGDKL